MEITISQKKKAQKIVKQQGLDFVVLFGSRANNKENEKSDLDIAVLDKRQETLQRFKRLFSGFSKIFKGYNVDLRFIQGAEPVFLYQVFKHGLFLAGNINNFHQYRAFAYKNFVDSASLFALKDKILKSRQKKLNKRLENG